MPLKRRFSFCQFQFSLWGMCLWVFLLGCGEAQQITPEVETNQQLNGTSWSLNHFIISGREQTLAENEVMEISFAAHEIILFDGCNENVYGPIEVQTDELIEPQMDEPIYLLTQYGDFIYPASSGYGVWKTLSLCFIVDGDGERGAEIGFPEQMPLLESVEHFEVTETELMLYYSGETEGVMVFDKLSSPR